MLHLCSVPHVGSNFQIPDPSPGSPSDWTTVETLKTRNKPASKIHVFYTNYSGFGLTDLRTLTVTPRAAVTVSVEALKDHDGMSELI